MMADRAFPASTGSKCPPALALEPQAAILWDSDDHLTIVCMCAFHNEASTTIIADVCADVCDEGSSRKGRDRRCRPSEWDTNVKKRKSNSGLEYVNASGVPHAAKSLPTQVSL